MCIDIWELSPELEWIKEYVNDSNTSYVIPSYKILRIIRLQAELEAKLAESEKKLAVAVEALKELQVIVNDGRWNDVEVEVDRALEKIRGKE